jgi:transketolase
MADPQLDELCINTIRFLSVDAVEKARSGHPGTPMGAAPIAYVLWDRFLRHNPVDPRWIDRDRFVLSAGHASMLLYSLLYLTGYAVSLEEIKQFRQWGSLTPGHPEYGLTPGVEVTTGPLGQGFANGVGMAIAERRLAAMYNHPDHEIIDHYTYGLISDGDLEEGVAAEAASLAGHLKLNKLIYLYDSNGIQQDGKTEQSFTENAAQRFRAYGWNVIGPIDGLDIDAIEWAIGLARSQTSRPNLIIFRTTIGYGSPNKAGTHKAHGEPLGEEEVKLAKEKLGWPYPEPFTVPTEALAHFRKAIDRGKAHQEQWQSKYTRYRQTYPEDARNLNEVLIANLPEGWDISLAGLSTGLNNQIATRDASGQALNAVAIRVPALVGGAADLGESTRTLIQGNADFQPGDYTGRNIRYGLREHAMAAITNGISLHGGLIPYAASFLIFSDYMRPSIRLAAIMKLRLIYIFTHDSIGLGEDGPTHQPVEQIMGLRMIPNMTVIRPADALETLEAWKFAMQNRECPVALILTRQKLPVLDRTKKATSGGLHKGGYILRESSSSPKIILIGTGSEVHLALDAAETLEKKGIAVRVVSLPSWEIFDRQTQEYRDMVLPPAIKTRISIEAGTTMGWEKYVGPEGIALGVSHFGASAPGEVVYKQYGFTSQRLIDTALKIYKEG